MLKKTIVPSGAIMFFDRADCPDGWTALNSEGAFIRDIGGEAAARGVLQEGGVPNIKGKGPRVSSEIFYKRSGYSKKPLTGPYVYAKDTDVLTGGEKGDGASSSYQGWNFDASLASSIYKDDLAEVRPKNIAYLACKKN